MTTYLLCFVIVFAAGCEGGSGDPSPDARAAGIDAPRTDGPVGPDGAAGPDARLGTAVTVVDCAASTPTGDVWYYEGIGYMVTGEISVGQVVRFHDLATHTADHVAGLWNASGDAEQCIRFDEAGSYPFRCYFHSAEQGAITVQ